MSNINYLNRKLGLIENLFNILHDLSAMIDVNVVRIEGSLRPDILQQALDLVQKRHPLLQVYIVDSSDGAYFKALENQKIPLDIIEKHQDAQWIEIAENELHRKFTDDMEPLCRVTFLRSSLNDTCSEIIITFHHSIADGLSCMRFIHEVLSYCQQIADGDRISEEAPLQLLPPLENLLDDSLYVQNLKDSQEKIEIEKPTPKLIIEGEASASDRRTCITPRFFSKEKTVLLMNRCKQEATTVNGALCAAMLFAVAKYFSVDTSVDLSCGVNINLRKYCNPKVNDDYMGCLISLVQEIYQIDKNTIFWELARECKAKVNDSINQGLHIQNVSNNSKIAHMNKDVILQISEHNMGRNSTINVSNRGKYNCLDKYGDVRVKELYFATGLHIVGSCFWLGAVTFHEQLFCSFTYVIPVVKTNTAELLADSVMTILQDACLSNTVTLV